jgi:hypothetical protein
MRNIQRRIGRSVILRLTCTSAILCLLAMASVRAQVTTSQYNNQRTGATLTEIFLTPEDVNPKHFGKLGSFQVDGAVFAQPLFVPAVEIPGKGKHDVIFVATEQDSMYAFDAYRTNDAPLWHVSLLDQKNGETPLSSRDVACPFIQPNVGITSTPVIDLKTGTLYVLARTKAQHTFANTEHFQRLHALAINTGAEKFGGPVVIAAAVPGHGAGATNGQVQFDPLRQNPRASLLLVNNVVYLTWASSCDVPPYHGWIMAYDAKTLQKKGVLNVTPNGSEGGIWAADTGPAADENGNVFVPTGNGTFDASNGGSDYGDSILKVTLQGASLTIADYFTPFNQAQLSDSDADLGSSGPVLLPDQPGPHRHFLLQPTKSGALYVVDRDQMGKFHSEGDAVVQRIEMDGGGYGAMAYWNGHVFFAANGGRLRDYVVNGSGLNLAKTSFTKFEDPGATPSISANGKQNAIVWAVATKTWDGADRPAVLYAFDAKDIDGPIYSSDQNADHDRAGMATRFVIPLVVNGHVYFAARGEVDVYGLRTP